MKTILRVILLIINLLFAVALVASTLAGIDTLCSRGMS